MKIAYFSPLNPQRSGISDYSEELLPYLGEQSEIALFVDGFAPTNDDLKKRFRVINYRRNPSALEQLSKFDAALYHMGNDHRYHAGIFDTMRRYPGFVVFHDFALQDFFLGLARERKSLSVYLDEVQSCHGLEARRSAEDALAGGNQPPFIERPLDYPLNCRLAMSAKGIIVHSQWSKKRFQGIAPSVPVAHIQMPVKPIELSRNIKDSKTIKLASFGLIIPGKAIDQILRVLSGLRDEFDFHYTLVGAENPYFNVRSVISAHRLEDRVTITGHVSLQEFEQCIVNTDIAINLRERTVGETSASLCRIMAAAVPVVVSNVGSFSELPNDSVVKVDNDIYSDRMLRAFLQRLMGDENLRRRIGENAKRYVTTEHDIKRSAARYLTFMQNTLNEHARHELLESVSHELRELGGHVSDKELLRSVATEVATLAPLAAFPGSLQQGNGHNAPDNEIVPADDSDAKEPWPDETGRLSKLVGIDYKRAAIEYPRKLDPERRHYLSTKPFYNLANKPPKHLGEGMDAETFRHFCDFANMAVALALPAGKRILDVGCGSGWLSEFLARLGYNVTGIDISPELIDIAAERLASQKYGADHETPLACRFLVHDIETGPLDQQFDAVVCYDSLHHFEDEQAVVKNLAAMTPLGGVVFILEGERPEVGSPTEVELIDVMRRYETLESPFSRPYLQALLDRNGLAIIGDYVSVNGLFDRSNFPDDLLRVKPPDVNYLLCKKVCGPGRLASEVADSRDVSSLSARITCLTLPDSVKAGSTLKFSVLLENSGSGLWLIGPAERAGSVMIGIKLLNERGTTIFERHGTPPLPYAVAPGEKVKLNVELPAPLLNGEYKLKIDLVAQHVCWFEEAGSEIFEQSITIEQ